MELDARSGRISDGKVGHHLGGRGCAAHFREDARDGALVLIFGSGTYLGLSA